MVRAIISYARDDAAILDEVVLPQLKSLGVDTWYDKEVPTASFWIEEVVKQIRQADWLIVVLSAKYQSSVANGSGACNSELRWIVDHVSTARHPGALIVLLQHGDVPDLLRVYQYIDIRADAGALPTKLKALLEAGDGATPHSAKPILPYLAQPNVDGPDGVPDLARYNFHCLAPEYNQSLWTGNSMQAENASVLLSMLRKVLEKKKLPKPRTWLDAGAGTGLVGAIASSRQAAHRCGWLLQCKVRAAFDYAPGMLSLLSSFTQHYSHCFEADLRTVTPDVLMARTGENAVELIVANNVLHWLFTPSAISTALRRCRNLLRDGGLLAASIAAVGTGSYFLTAYEAEVSEALAGRDRQKWAPHVANPIGLQRLEEIVKLARAAGFTIELARQVYEPRSYLGGIDEYVRDARSYGDKVFMAPLLNQSERDREEVWNRIQRRFAELYSAAFGEAGYQHDQHMIYLVARRVD